VKSIVKALKKELKCIPRGMFDLLALCHLVFEIVCE
jgi:hypothetical protein